LHTDRKPSLLADAADKPLLTDVAVSCVIPGPRIVKELLLNIAACRNGALAPDLKRQVETTQD